MTLSCLLVVRPTYSEALTSSSILREEAGSICKTVEIPRIVVKEDSNISNFIDISPMSYDLQESYILINVSDYFGATDSERIQNALDDVPDEGAIVFIPSGIWVAFNLIAKSKTIVMGASETILKRPENTTSPFLIFNNRSSFAVTSILFDGQNISQATGISITSCIHFEIVNNTFVDVSRNAIHVNGVCEDFEIKQNKFTRCNIATILVFGSPGERSISNFTIANNILTDGIDNGKIGIAFSANGTVANNNVTNCEYGIATRCVSHTILRNNFIADCIGYAIYLGTQPGDLGSDNIEIINNRVANCNIGVSRYYGSYPIYNITLLDNSLVHNEQWDIYADFPATFINNTITSIEKLKILDTNVNFIGTMDVEGQPILPGDIDDDLRIDMRDIGMVARLFGSDSSSGNWNPSADIIWDGVIDMKDIAFVTRRFGFQYI